MIREARELLAYHARSTARFAEHDVHNVFSKAIRDLQRVGFGELPGKRVLDLGCGQRYAFALQCAAAGADVTALDIDHVRPDALPVAFLRTARRNGIKRATKSAIRRVLWDGRYYRALEGSAGRPLRAFGSSIDFAVADPAGSHLSLPSNSFDMIASNAVLEHVKDVEGFAAEVARLLSSGGYFYTIIHNFYSLSGGHHLEWAFPDERPSANVAPWDHLRESRSPAWTYLNRRRPEQYKDAFGKHLRLLDFTGVGVDHDPGRPEGERFLTTELAAELSGYPRDLLLTRLWRMICQKA
jgi:SAM-dependent methyltransferase